MGYIFSTWWGKCSYRVLIHHFFKTKGLQRECRWFSFLPIISHFALQYLPSLERPAHRATPNTMVFEVNQEVNRSNFTAIYPCVSTCLAGSIRGKRQLYTACRSRVPSGLHILPGPRLGSRNVPAVPVHPTPLPG